MDLVKTSALIGYDLSDRYRKLHAWYTEQGMDTDAEWVAKESGVGGALGRGEANVAKRAHGGAGSGHTDGVEESAADVNVGGVLHMGGADGLEDDFGEY